MIYVCGCTHYQAKSHVQSHCACMWLRWGQTRLINGCVQKPLTGWVQIISNALEHRSWLPLITCPHLSLSLSLLDTYCSILPCTFPIPLSAPGSWSGSMSWNSGSIRSYFEPFIHAYVWFFFLLFFFDVIVLNQRTGPSGENRLFQSFSQRWSYYVVRLYH